MNNTNCTYKNQNEFNAAIYVPQRDGSLYLSYCVVCTETKKEVYYNYNIDTWFSGEEVVQVKTWRYPGAVPKKLTLADKIRNVLSGFDAGTLSLEETTSRLQKVFINHDE